jgi:tetratricopeptide (TPR) repeat protein
VPDAIDGSTSDSGIALNEVEIIEASGPLPLIAQLPRAVEDETRRVSLAMPAEAYAPPVAEAGRTVSMFTQKAELESAVQLFDQGLMLRAEGRHGEALDAWEKALALAPENRLYQSHVRRLRAQLSALRGGQDQGQSI